jgi:hypothetical protein
LFDAENLLTPYVVSSSKICFPDLILLGRMLLVLVVQKDLLKTLLKAFTVCVVVGTLLYIWFFIDMDLVRGFDFTAFLNAANIIKDGSGSLLYHINIQKRFLFGLVSKPSPIVFKSPPTLALFYMPFTFLPFELAYKTIATTLLLVATVSAFYMSRVFIEVNKELVFLCTLFFIPGALSILTGQPSYLLLLVWLFVIKYLEGGKSFNVGVVIGFFCNKPQYLLFTPFLLLFVKDKRKYLLGFFLTVLLHVLISGLLVGFNNLLSYFHFLKSTEIYIYGSDPYSQISLSALLFNISVYVTALKGKEYVISAFFYFLAFLYYAKVYSPKLRLQLLFALPLLILFFSPHVWEYDLTLILPSFFYLLSFSRRQIKSFFFTPVFFLVLLFWGWSVRLLGYPSFISLILFSAAVYIINHSKPYLFSFDRPER